MFEDSTQHNSDSVTEKITSPRDFMPALKAGPRIGKRKRRKLGRSLIATDTPVQDEITECRNKTKERKSQANQVKRPIFDSESKSRV
ncbi:hypothetical protein JYU34_015166 [Plutella xylostella]|uniref:Uncharacterized protein n=1 Tax=Plutella xylostella TaxID=51655 RepID=A0ABQ7Q7Y7_PLUXY|nr:hypothetical protein JYU34_015166 [Plutella xylostella]